MIERGTLGWHWLHLCSPHDCINQVLEFFDVVVPLDTRSRSATNRTNSIGGSLHIDLIEEDALVEVEMGPQPASPNDIMVNDTLADAVTPSRAARPHQDHSIM